MREGKKREEEGSDKERESERIIFHVLFAVMLTYPCSLLLACRECIIPLHSFFASLSPLIFRQPSFCCWKQLSLGSMGSMGRRVPIPLLYTLPSPQLFLLLFLLALSYSAPRRSFLFLLRFILQIEFYFAGLSHTFFVVFGFNTAVLSMASSLSLLSHRVTIARSKHA